MGCASCKWPKTPIMHAYMDVCICTGCALSSDTLKLEPICMTLSHIVLNTWEIYLPTVGNSWEITWHRIRRIAKCMLSKHFTLLVVFVLLWRESIVAYRPVAKRWLCKHLPFLGNGSVNTFPLLGSRFLIIQQLDATVEELCFLCGPCRDVISKGQS
jgi:hypothetical protein